MSTTSTMGLSKLKSAIRSIKRFLEKKDVDEKLRVEKEKVLKDLSSQLPLAQGRFREKKLSTKYHKVKFFEKKKVVRDLKRLRKKLEEGDDETVVKQIREKEDQYLYIIHFPASRRYVSLFGKERDDLDEEEACRVRREKKRESSRAMVREIVDRMKSEGQLKCDGRGLLEDPVYLRKGEDGEDEKQEGGEERGKKGERRASKIAKGRESGNKRGHPDSRQHIVSEKTVKKRKTVEEDEKNESDSLEHDDFFLEEDEE
eukprot:TRINITY_DN1098_c0_g2_i1.p1 TRINITY_DN1098_c0_g2~~TRINITY_DN1098_c0_g2_i1.p1  ORF type:complete len:258 (-),score=95.96 TRINITY_DN1098_c0_g2_i1:76-849(-)